MTTGMTAGIGVVTEEGAKLIRATVQLNGKPLENATVRFLVRRSFGDLLLGEDKTLDDGTAAVRFPKALPGGPHGELEVIAEVKPGAEYAEGCGEVATFAAASFAALRDICSDVGMLLSTASASV